MAMTRSDAEANGLFFNMKNLFFLAICLTSVACHAAQQTTSTSDINCQLEHEQEIQLLQQNVATFDADNLLGWRLLANKGCITEAIALIRKYQEKNGNTYRTAFHEAQLSLVIEDRKNARRLLFASLRSDLPADDPFKWNDYVLGYLAYVDQDKEALAFYISKLEKNAADIRNKINVKVLRQLLTSFDRPYRDIFPRK